MSAHLCASAVKRTRFAAQTAEAVQSCRRKVKFSGAAQQITFTQQAAASTWHARNDTGDAERFFLPSCATPQRAGAFPRRGSAAARPPWDGYLLWFNRL